MKLTSTRNKPMTPGWRGERYLQIRTTIVTSWLMGFWIMSSPLPNLRFSAFKRKKTSDSWPSASLSFWRACALPPRCHGTPPRVRSSGEQSCGVEWVRGLNCCRQNRQVMIHSMYNRKHHQTSTNCIHKRTIAWQEMDTALWYPNVLKVFPRKLIGLANWETKWNTGFHIYSISPIRILSWSLFHATFAE